MNHHLHRLTACAGPAPLPRMRTFRAEYTLHDGTSHHMTIEAFSTVDAIQHLLTQLDEHPAKLDMQQVADTAFSTAVTQPSDHMVLLGDPDQDAIDYSLEDPPGATPLLPHSTLDEIAAGLRRQHEAWHRLSAERDAALQRAAAAARICGCAVDDEPGTPASEPCSLHLPLRTRDLMMAGIATVLAILAMLMWPGLVGVVLGLALSGGLLGWSILYWGRTS